MGLLDDHPVAILVVGQPGDVVVVLVPVLPGVEIVLVEDRQGDARSASERDDHREGPPQAQNDGARDGETAVATSRGRGVGVSRPEATQPASTPPSRSGSRVIGWPSEACTAWSWRPSWATSCWRSAGSLASPCSSTRHSSSGTPRDRRSGGASLVMRFTSDTRLCSVAPANGGRPETRQNRVDASEYTSEATVGGAPGEDLGGGVHDGPGHAGGDAREEARAAGPARNRRPWARRGGRAGGSRA